MRVALTILCFGLVASGCHCNPPQTQSGVGEIDFVYDQGGTTITSPNGEYDFGKVAMGVTKALKVTVQNRGTGALDLQSLEQVDGETVKVGDADAQGPVFTVAFQPVRIGAGASMDFDATFIAPMETDPMVLTKDHAATLRLRAGNTEQGKDTADVVFKGTAVAGDCTLPDTLDFGAVATGDVLKRTITIHNLSALPATADVGGFTSNSGDHLNFRFAPESATGSVNIDTGLSKDVVIEFRPADVKDYLAFVKMRAAEQCPDVTVKLIGTGVDQVVNCTPNPADFGYLTPGLTSQLEVTLSNTSLTDVTLSNAAVNAGTVPSVDYSVLGPTTVTIPKAQRVPMPDGSQPLVPGQVKMQLTFHPATLGPHNATLTAATTLEHLPIFGCPVKGSGGGPDIDLKPSGTLNFQRVPFFATAPKPFFVTRKVTVQNLGTVPSPPDDRANLHLGTKDATGHYQRPYWRVVPKNTQSLDTEICVGIYDDVNFPMNPCRQDLPVQGLVGGYDPMFGIEASTGKAQLDIPIRVTPSAPNKSMEWDVVFLSNDPDEPEITLNVKAQSVILPPCNFQLTPSQLNFGLVTPPAYRDLSFAIKNLGVDAGDVCLITNLDLEEGTDLIYSLPNGPLDQYEMAAQETVTVTVRSAPTGSVGTTVRTAVGNVLVGISNPNTPQREVALSTSVATSCLTIAPSDLDFGTVQKDCNSSRRTFSIYNTCTTPVTVNNWSMVAAAGIVPGSSPSCPASATSCPEFLIDGTPTFVMGTQIQPGNSMPETFALKYHPLDYGTDTGAFMLRVTQNGQLVDYIVTLKGKGDTFGLNVDTFQQDPRPKADILLVIDNSCSMADRQTAMGQNFAAFLNYATSNNVDFQIAVITTDLTSNVEGQFVGDPMNGKPYILKPSTPMLPALFADKVAVGISGGDEGMAEPAVKALTAPLISTVNAGFLRADAVLAIVAVTDAGDQSPLAATIYENELLNIKGAQRPAMISYNMIGPFGTETPQCPYDSFHDITKNVYLVQRLNGVKDDICTPSWATTLQTIGKTAFGFRTNFYLTATPDLTSGHTIEVRIDGVLMAQTDPLSMAPVWHYEALSNSVVFEPLFVPEPGKVLTVTYYVTCN